MKKIVFYIAIVLLISFLSLLTFVYFFPPEEIENTQVNKNVEDYIEVREYKISDEDKGKYFSEYGLKQIVFKDLPDDLVTPFIIKQNEILDKNFKEIKDEFKENNYKGKALTNCYAEINKNVLSVAALNKIDVLEDSSENNTFLNINLDTKKALNTSETLDSLGYTKEKLVDLILSSLDKYSERALKNGKDISKEEFISKKPEFKKYITEHLNDFNVYLIDKKLYCNNYSFKLLSKLGYGYPTGSGGRLEVIKLEK